MTNQLLVNEIYLSLQGESSWAGWPCIFVRLTGCPLRCSYCDSAYAFKEGRRLSIEAVLGRVRELAAPFRGGATDPRLPLVELTGGEPLAQPASRRLLAALCDEGFCVLLETSGAFEIASVDPRVLRIVDVKCPGSGEVDRNLWKNLADLRATDELKFVLATEEDYDWMKEILIRHRLPRICTVLVSMATPLSAAQHDPSLNPIPAGQRPLTRETLAEHVVRDALPVRYQLQMHKFIWAPDQRGV